MKKTVLLITIGFSLFLDAFQATNGVIIDTITGLEWQDSYNRNNNTIKNSTWQNAVSYCENLSLDSKDDWRLPNKNELLSIVNYNQINPTIDKSFSNTNNNYYWSSTTKYSSYSKAWTVTFSYGNSNYDTKSSSHYIRCVRGEE